MKDEYGRKLQCPKCNSKNIGVIKGSEGKPSELLYCESCGMIGSAQMFRAIPSSENPSRRDSDIEDPNDLKVSKEIKEQEYFKDLEYREAWGI